jgi:hypothetical protein
MHNVRHENGVWIFRISRRDVWSELVRRLVILGPTLILFTVAWLLGSTLFTVPWEDDTGAGVIIVLLCLVAPGVILVVMMAMDRSVSGLWARYEVRIDCGTRKIVAYDRRRGEVLWESAYDPTDLYLSQTRVRTGKRSRLRPALVYGDLYQDFVRFDVPTQRRTMLTTASRQELKALMVELGKDNP